MGVKKTSTNLAGLLALPCRIGEFSCGPPYNEEEKNTRSTLIINNWYKTSVNYFWHNNLYIYNIYYIIFIIIYIYILCK